MDLDTSFCCWWFWNCTSWHDLALSLSSWNALIVSTSKPPANWKAETQIPQQLSQLQSIFERPVNFYIQHECHNFLYLMHPKSKLYALNYKLFFFGTTANCFKLCWHSLHVLHGQLHRCQLDLQCLFKFMFKLDQWKIDKTN